ncbi:hypothetical protein PR048_015998 [Dryococelus australis]|uniref:Uncharacterized protein n=1 Tax=Dryococelus australis TaxID=614101 RepID=A0ABQ9HIH8_9NEOP|nr:hypothetical protein PR048_015998 [Dryococelus australis]
MPALHEITAQRIQNVQKSLKSTGTAPTDGRCCHTNKPQMLPNDTTVSIHERINSFKVCVFLAWTKFLTLLYATQCPFATRPIKHLVISQDHPLLIQYRLTYIGTNDTAVVVPPKKRRPTPDLQPSEFRLPPCSYEELIPINEDKYKDLQVLKNFCEDEAKCYFAFLPHTTRGSND